MIKRIYFASTSNVTGNQPDQLSVGVDEDDGSPSTTTAGPVDRCTWGG